MAVVVISVVIPARDAAGVLPGQLRALAEQRSTEAFEVIVADNGSTDDTVDLVESWRSEFDTLRWVDASGRPGVSRARNAGAASANGRHVLYCDADDEAAPGWIAAMSTALEEFHAVGGRLDRRRLSAADRLRDGVVVGRDLTPWPGYLPFASGASLGVRADVLQALGGFDESFTAGGNDVEFSWRVQLGGYRLGFAGAATMHYRERTGARAIAHQSYGYGLQDPHLYRCFAASGMPPSGVRPAVRSWAHLLAYAPRYAKTASARSQWIRSSSRRVGRMVGSLHHRCLYL